MAPGAGLTVPGVREPLAMEALRHLTFGAPSTSFFLLSVLLRTFGSTRDFLASCVDAAMKPSARDPGEEQPHEDD